VWCGGGGSLVERRLGCVVGRWLVQPVVVLVLCVGVGVVVGVGRCLLVARSWHTVGS
jgi:hypothetical protein